MVEGCTGVCMQMLLFRFSQLMKEIEKHKDAKPFLEPVDTKAFPQYKKYIKHPMDLGKISSKLANNE